MKFLLFILPLLTSLASFSEVDANKVKLFDSEEVLNATLQMDISYFRENREELREDGILGIFSIEGGNSFDVEILSRGHGSMDNVNPPFKLVFNKKDNGEKLFAGIKKIKAFTSPNEGSLSGNKQVLSNYLIYKLLEGITPYAFKTRMFNVKFIDTSNLVKTYEARVFLKEPNKVIAKRLGMTYVPFKNPNNAIDVNLDMSTVELITAFEFLAGNWDHAIPGIYSTIYSGVSTAEKNMKMLMNKNKLYYPVAYDFDMSGFIDRGICWWEIGFDLMVEGRSEHFKNVKPICDTVVIKNHMEFDLKSFKYKDVVMKHFPFIKNKISAWRTKYSKQLALLSPNYLKNLDDYLGVMSLVIDNERGVNGRN